MKKIMVLSLTLVSFITVQASEARENLGALGKGALLFAASQVHKGMEQARTSSVGQNNDLTNCKKATWCVATTAAALCVYSYCPCTSCCLPQIGAGATTLLSLVIADQAGIMVEQPTAQKLQ